MKLHLPSGLRAALLACFAAFAGIGTTLTTATITGGVFAVTALSAASVAQAANYADVTFTVDPHANLGTGAATLTSATTAVINGNVVQLNNSDVTLTGAVIIDGGSTNSVVATTTNGGYGGRVSVLCGNNAISNDLTSLTLTGGTEVNLNGVFGTTAFLDAGRTQSFKLVADNASIFFNGTTLAVDVEVGAGGLRLNGSSSTSYNFSGTFTGSGTVYVIDGIKNASKTMTLSGNVSQFSGTWTENANTNSNSRKWVFGGTGVSAATATNGIVGGNVGRGTNARSKVVYQYTDAYAVAGQIWAQSTEVTGGQATFQNTVDSASLSISSGASATLGAAATVGALSVVSGAALTVDATGSLTLNGASTLGTSILNNGTITFGENATLDISALTAVDNVYKLFADGSTGTVTGLTVDKITGFETAGKTWTLDPTTFNLVSSDNPTWGGGALDWHVGKELTTGGAFTAGGSITFTGETTATLGENISASSIAVNENVALSIVGGDYTLTADELFVSAGGSATLDVNTTLTSIGGEGRVSVNANRTLSLAELTTDSWAQLAGSGTVNYTGDGLTIGANDNFTGELAFASGKTLTLGVGTYSNSFSGGGDIRFAVSADGETVINGDIDIQGNIWFYESVVDTANTLTIGEGVTVSVNEFEGRYEQNGTSTYNVSAGATLDVTGKLRLARDGKGILNIAENATVKAGMIEFSQNATWTGANKGGYINLNGGTLLVGDEGMLVTNDPNAANVRKVTLNGGTLGVLDGAAGWTAASGITFEMTENSDTTLSTGTGSVTIGGILTGAGTLTKVDSGTLTLGGLGGGATVDVTEGTLIMSTGATVEDGATIIANTGTTVKVAGWSLSEAVSEVSTATFRAPDYVVDQGGTIVQESTLSATGGSTGAAYTVLDTSGFTGDALMIVAGRVAVVTGGVQNPTQANLGTIETITLDGGGLVTAGSSYSEATYTVSQNLVIGSNGGYIRVHGDYGSTLSVTDYTGKLSGSGTLTKEDGGPVRFSGDLSDFTGAIKLTGGTLSIASDMTTPGDLELRGAGTITTENSADLSVGNILQHDAVTATLSGSIQTTAIRQKADATIVIAGEGTLVTAERYVGADANGAATIMTVKDKAMLNITGSVQNRESGQAAFMLGHWPEGGGALATFNIEGGGTVNVLNTGISVRDGGGDLNVKDGGTLNIKQLTVNAEGRVDVLLEAGGRINIGSGGVSSLKSFTVKGGTLGILADADSWTSAAAFEIAGDLTIHTEKYDATANNYAGAYTGQGGTIVLSGGVTTGEHTLTKTGVGTLQLGGTSIGNLSIQGGTLQATHADGLTVTGLAMAEGTSILYAAGTAAPGKVTAASYNDALTLALSGDFAEGSYELFQGATTLADTQVALDTSLLARGLTAVKSVTDGLVSVQIAGAAVAGNLTWKVDGANDTWSVNDALNWTADSTDTKFCVGDNVTFAGAGETITVSGTVNAASVTVTGTDYVFSGDGAIVTPTLTVESDASVTISNSGANSLGAVTVNGTGSLAMSLDGNVGASLSSLAYGGAGSLVFTSGTGTLNKAITGDNAAVNLTVKDGADLTISTQQTKLATTLVEKGATLRLGSGGETSVMTGSLEVCGSLITSGNGDSFGWGNPATGGFTGLTLEGGTWRVEGGNQTLTNTPITLNNGTMELALTSGYRLDFFTAMGNFIRTEDSSAGQSVIKLADGAEYGGTLTNRLHIRTGALTFDIARSAALASSDTSDLRVDVHVVHGETTDGTPGQFVKTGDGILELTAGLTGTVPVELQAGTLRLSGAATSGDGSVAMTAGSTLELDTNYEMTAANAISGEGNIVKKGTNAVRLTGLDDSWKGTLDVKNGTLGVAEGAALTIGADRTLKLAAGTGLSSNLTLNGGELSLDVTDSSTLASLGGNTLNLDALTKLTLVGTPADINVGSSITLLTDVGSVLVNNAALAADALANEYFSNLDSQLQYSSLKLENGSLVLFVDSLTPKLYWEAGSEDWNTTDTNWALHKDGTADQVYTANATVYFTDEGLNGASPATVTIAGTVEPAALVVDAAGNYTFASDATTTGSIGGATSLLKKGEGTLTISLANTYTGGTTLEAGVLNATVTGALGTGKLTVNGGTLNASAENVLSGAGIFINDGGTVNVSAANALGTGENAWDVNLNGGTLVLEAGIGNKVVFGSGTLHYKVDETRELSRIDRVGNDTSTITVDVAANNKVIWSKASANASIFAHGMTLTGEGSLTISSEGIATLGASGKAFDVDGNLIFHSNISGNNNIDLESGLTGDGTVLFDGENGAATINGDNSYFAGTITVQNGNIGDGSGDTFFFLHTNAAGGEKTTLVLNDACIRGNGDGYTFTAGTVQVKGENIINGGYWGEATSAKIIGALTGDGTLAIHKAATLTFTGSLQQFKGTLRNNQAGVGVTFAFGEGGEYAQAGNIFGDGVTLTSLVGTSAAPSYVFNYSNDVSMNATVNGVANVTQQGTGTLTLTEDNGSVGTLSVEKGIVKIDGGSWIGTVSVGADGTLHLVNQTTAVKDVTSTGTVILEAGNNLTSLTGGNLTANGTAEVTTLAGTVGTVTVASGATLTLGSTTAIGTLTGAGNLTVETGKLSLGGVSELGGTLTVTEGELEMVTGLAAGQDGKWAMTTSLSVNELSGVTSITIDKAAEGATLSGQGPVVTVTNGITGTTSLAFNFASDNLLAELGLGLGESITLLTAGEDLSSLTISGEKKIDTSVYTAVLGSDGKSVMLAYDLNGTKWDGSTTGDTWTAANGDAWEGDPAASPVGTVIFTAAGTSPVSVEGTVVANLMMVDAADKSYAFTAAGDDSLISAGGITISHGDVQLGVNTTVADADGATNNAVVVIGSEATGASGTAVLTVNSGTTLTTERMVVNHNGSFTNAGTTTVAGALIMAPVTGADGTTPRELVNTGGTLSFGEGSSVGSITGGDVTATGASTIAALSGISSLEVATGDAAKTVTVSGDVAGSDGDADTLTVTSGVLSVGGALSGVETLSVAAGKLSVGGLISGANSVEIADGATLEMTAASGAQSFAGFVGAGAFSGAGIDLTLTAVTTAGTDVTAKSLTLTKAASQSTFGAVTTGALTLDLDACALDASTAAPTAGSALATVESLTAAGTTPITLTLNNAAALAAKLAETSFTPGATAADAAYADFTLLTQTAAGAGSLLIELTNAADVAEAFATAGLFDAALKGDTNTLYASAVEVGSDIVLRVSTAQDRVWNTADDFAQATTGPDAKVDFGTVENWYDRLNHVTEVNVNKDRTINLAEDTAAGDTLDDTWNAATHPDGLAVRNLTGTADLTIKGTGTDLVSLINDHNSDMQGKLVLDGIDGSGFAVIARSADAGHASELGLNALQLDNGVRFTVKDTGNVSVKDFSMSNGSYLMVEAPEGLDVEKLTAAATGGTISGQVNILGTGGDYRGAYDNAVVNMAAANASQTLAPRAGLTVTGSQGTAVLDYQSGHASMTAIRTTGATVLLRNMNTGGQQKDAGTTATMHTLTLGSTSSMQGGKLGFSVNAGDIAAGLHGGAAPVITQGADLNLSGTTLVVTQADTVSTTTYNVSRGTKGITLFTLASGGLADGVAVDFGDSQFFKRYFENVRVEDGKVLADIITDYYARKLKPQTPNGAAGMQMLDTAALVLNPQGDTKSYGDLANVLNSLDDFVKKSDSGAADRLAAAVAGSGAASLGMALSGDVERQLKAIRNRTTTMGVDPSVVNEGMPYFNAWINGEGDYRTLESDGTFAGYTLNSWGGTVGFDMDVNPSLSWGLALTAMYGDYSADSTDVAEGELSSYYVSAFARATSGSWVHTFVGTVGMNWAELNRTVRHNYGSYKTEGETEGTSVGFLYEVARTFALNEDATACWQPVFNVAYRHIGVDGYSETGSDAALTFGDQTLDLFTIGLGARMQAVVGENIYNRTSVFEARALAKFDVGDREVEMDSALIAASAASGKVKSAELDAFGIELGAGLTVPVGMDAGSIFVDASVELRGSSYTNFNGTVGYRINF